MRYSHVLLLIAFLFSIGGCTTLASPDKTPTLTLNITPTQTPLPSATSTPLPTATPTLEPTPIGAGGRLMFSAYKSVFKVPGAGEFDVYAANTDGSGTTLLTDGPEGTSNILAGTSPDGKQVLYYSTTQPVKKIYQDDNRADLWVTNLDGTGTVQINPPDIHTYLGAAAWAANGSIYFAGWDAKGLEMFHVNSDASGLIPAAAPVSLAPTGKAEILFYDTAGTGIYWVIGGYCNNGSFCNARYYWTALDGSDQKQVWKWLKNANDAISLSPDGKWLAYQAWVSNQIPDSSKNGCYVAAIDGSVNRQMQGKHPSCDIFVHQQGFWSPDGKSILYLTSDDDQKKYPLHIYSPEDNRVTDLPDIQTSSCEEHHWLDEGHILFAYCRSNYLGWDQPTSSRLFDLATGQVTLLPGTDYCEVSFSPDNRQAFLYNCHSEGNGQVSFRFYRLELETGTVTPLFMEAMNTSQQDAYWTLFIPKSWNGWSH